MTGSYQQPAADLNEGKITLQESRIAANSASEAICDFFATLSHEIRSPLAAILGFAELLVPHDELEREKISAILRNGNALVELINEALEFSTIEAGRLVLQRNSFNPAQLLEEVRLAMDAQATQKSLSLQVHFGDRLPLAILSDPTRLRQILVNLVATAIKFTNQGSVTLSAHWIPESKQICFEVVDTGIGINAEQQSRLFNPFEKLDSSVAQVSGGFGLGLAISQRLAIALRGEITIKSKIGHGSIFSCYIPGQIPEDMADDAIAVSIADNAVSGVASFDAADRRNTPEISNLRVLVVDDRRDIRRLAQCFIESTGAEVIFAENGRQALELMSRPVIESGEVNLILMDVQMPELDGLETTRQLRSAGCSIPIIALTGNVSNHDRSQCIQAGFTDFLPKPVDAQQLINVLKSHGRRSVAQAATSDREKKSVD